MKIAQILKASGQTNGHSMTWDSTTRLVKEEVWAWPSGVNPNRVTEMFRTTGKVMGLTWFLMEADGRYYLNHAYTATAGDIPTAITELVPQHLVPFDQNNFLISSTLVVAILSWRSQYAIYDFSADTPAISFGTIGSFPYDIGGLTVVSYADGMTRLIAMSGDTGLMYLSTPIDGSSLNIAVTLPIIPPPSAITDYADISVQIAYGSSQLARILAAGTGIPVWGDGWMIGNDPGYPGLYAIPLASHSVVTPLSSNTIRVEFVTGVNGDQATTLMLDATGVITDKAVVAVSGISISGSDKWFVMRPAGVTPPVVIPPFWHGFIKSFERI